MEGEWNVLITLTILGGLVSLALYRWIRFALGIGLLLMVCLGICLYVFAGFPGPQLILGLVCPLLLVNVVGYVFVAPEALPIKPTPFLVNIPLQKGKVVFIHWIKMINLN